jgi:hypothetical protein
MTADFVRAQPDPASNRSERRRLERLARVPAGVLRQCPRCQATYRTAHRNAFLCEACHLELVAGGVPFNERLRFLL